MRAWARLLAQSRANSSVSLQQGAAACATMPPGSGQQCRSPAMPVAQSAPPAAGRSYSTASIHHWVAPSTAASCMRGLRRAYAGISHTGGVAPGICHIGAGALRGQPHRQRCSVPAVADAPAAEYDAVEAVAVQSPGPDGSRPRLVLVDAFAVLYRAHHGFKPDQRLRNSAGVDTSVIFGFLQVVLALMERPPQPTHLAVVFDSGSGGGRGKTFRHEIYEGYKGNRQTMPPEIAAALPKLTVLLEHMQIPTFKVPGLEADDMIATLAVRGVDAGFLVDIASPDKDFFQLLRPGLELLRHPNKATPRGQMFQRYSLESFRAAFQDLEPHQFADVLALMGDASDNVPGVKGIGPKGAVTLLQQHGDIETLLANADQVARKQTRETLMSEDGAAAARLSSRLVTLEKDVDVPDLRVPLNALQLQLPDSGSRSRALEVLADLEMQLHSDTLRARWAAAVPSPS